MLNGEDTIALLKTPVGGRIRTRHLLMATNRAGKNLVDTIRSLPARFHFRAINFAGEITRHPASAKNNRAEEKKTKDKKILQIESGALAMIARMAKASLSDRGSLLRTARAFCGDQNSDKEVRDVAGCGALTDAPRDWSARGSRTEFGGTRFGLVTLSERRRGRRGKRKLQQLLREAIRHIAQLLIRWGLRGRRIGLDCRRAPDQKRPALEAAPSSQFQRKRI